MAPSAPTPQATGRLIHPVALGVFADLSGTLATFMPMKSVFILGAGDVPGFFPEFLITAGPAAVAMLLVGGAGVLAYTSGLASRALKNSDSPASLDGENPFALFVKNQITPSDSGRRERQIDVALLIVIAIVVSLASWVFFVFTLLWLIGVLLVIASRLRNTPRQAPFISGADALAHHAVRFITSSALWSTVMIAIASLLVFEPPLGLTGILLAAVFGRRFQQIAAKQISHAPQSVTPQSSGVLSPFGLVTNAGGSSSVPVPYDYLTTAVGMRVFRATLRDWGIDGDDFRIVGQPRRESLSIVAGLSSDNPPLLLRIFGTGYEDRRDEELTLRTNPYPVDLFGTEHAEPTVIAGFPAILIPLDKPEIVPDLTQTRRHEDVITWQTRIEASSQQQMQAGDESELATSLSVFIDSLEDQLSAAARLPGPTKQPLSAVLRQLPQIKARLSNIHPCLVPERPLGAADFYVGETGSLRFLGETPWRFGAPGQTWGRPDQYARAWASHVNKDGALTSDIYLATIHAHLRRLHNTLSARSLNQSASHANDLLGSLEGSR